MSSTDIPSNRNSHRLALVTSCVFLAIIISLPLIQLASELGALPSSWPTAFRLLPAIPRVLSAGGDPNASVYRRALAANQQLCDELRDYERLVTESAWPIKPPRTWLQAVLTGPLSSGNEQVVVGADGWLLFRPDVEALIRPGFLEPQRVRPGFAKAARQTNPLPAIRRFAADLKARGIRLMIVPVPSKAGLLYGEQGGAAAIHNASFTQFLAALNQEQIAVCDLSAVLRDDDRGDSSARILKTDSHWNPAGVRLAAQRVAEQARSIAQIASLEQAQYQTKTFSVENLGDTARLLGGDDRTRAVAPESCEITQVKNADDSDWRPDPHAEILLLGDSFTNIYSQAELGWGTSAGFAEHLSLALHTALDRIALNAGGALAARRDLLRQMQQAGNDRLAGKKLVIWQFAERELTFGDWQVLPLPPVSTKATPPKTSAEAVIDGLIVQAGHLPDPASLPYREALIPLHLREVQSIGGGQAPAEIVVYVWGLQDRRLTAMAGWKAGQRVQLKLVPWSSAEREFGRFARAELDDPDFRLIDLPTYWATP